jgi:hypothetical protein
MASKAPTISSSRCRDRETIEPGLSPENSRRSPARQGLRSRLEGPVVDKRRARTPFVIIVGLLAILGLLVAFRVIELRPRAASTVHAVFNYVEAAIWGVAGLWTIWRSRGEGSTLRVSSCVAAVAFLAFGLSDLVEVRTGTWYDPWWLFAWKAACVLTLLACYRLRQRVGR